MVHFSVGKEPKINLAGR